MLTIALDAMGGDNAPQAEVEGAIQAARTLGLKVILVGREDVLRKELQKHSGWQDLAIEIHHASEVITMEDSAAKAMRTKRDSSIRVATRLVKEGVAQGVVSAGNTGAVMATAKTSLGMLPGVDRPALASALPTLKGSPVVVVDVGANVDCTARMLGQFAIMGDVYARIIFKHPKPRVGLLSIGEEEHKGNELTKAATPVLKSLPINFIGNVEGRDIYSGDADVVVCDGFIGNVVLKVSEGVVDMIKHLLRESLTQTIKRKIGFFLSKSAFEDFRKRVDYSEYGGAPLLGVKGVCIICHGRSNATAIFNALRVAAEFAKGGMSDEIESELSRSTELRAPRAAAIVSASTD